MNRSRFARFAWLYLALTVVVIVWGGIVRATGSGAGCGASWPTCHGQIVPAMESWHTAVEYSHRLSTGVLGILTVMLVTWAFRAFPRGHQVRLGAVLTALFIVTESAVGAALVLLEAVAYNVSVGRAYWMAGHLINTLLLMGSATLLAWWASGGARLRLRGQGSLMLVMAVALIAYLVLGASGAVAALGDTLLEGMGIAKDEANLAQALEAAGVSSTEAAVIVALVELRILHPMIAVVTSLLALVAVRMAAARGSTPWGPRFAWWTTAAVVVQLALGALNVALKAPIWLQMVHLLMTNLIWVFLVLSAAEALGERPATSPQPATESFRPRPV